MKTQYSDVPPTERDRPVLPLFIEPTLLGFHWGRYILGGFYQYGKKHGIKIKRIDHWQDVMKDKSIRYLVVVATDTGLIEEIVDTLGREGMQTILLDGAVNRNDLIKITSDQRDAIINSLELLQKNRCSRPAFFGAKINDSSDLSKADAFALQVSPDDVYRVQNGAEECLQRLLYRLDRYDSIICANDIMAVYLLGKLIKMGVSVPGQLQLIGNGNLWLGAHTQPSITTVSYWRETSVDITAQICRLLDFHSAITRGQIFLKSEIVQRESTGCFTPTAFDSEVYRGLERLCENEADDCREIRQIKLLDRVLAYGSDMDALVVRRLVEGRSYEQIASESYIGLDAVKYHVKKLYRQLEIHRQQELRELISAYRIRL